MGTKKELRKDDFTLLELAKQEQVCRFSLHDPFTMIPHGYKIDNIFSFQKPVTMDEGLQVAEKIRAYRYLECSAKTKTVVHEVFVTATRAALHGHKGKKLKCQLL